MVGMWIGLDELWYWLFEAGKLRFEFVYIKNLAFLYIESLAFLYIYF